MNKILSLLTTSLTELNFLSLKPNKSRSLSISNLIDGHSLTLSENIGKILHIGYEKMIDVVYSLSLHIKLVISDDFFI